jgi:hypothetical protein
VIEQLKRLALTEDLITKLSEEIQKKDFSCLNPKSLSDVTQLIVQMMEVVEKISTMTHVPGIEKRAIVVAVVNQFLGGAFDLIEIGGLIDTLVASTRGLLAINAQVKSCCW